MNTITCLGKSREGKRRAEKRREGKGREKEREENSERRERREEERPSREKGSERDDDQHTRGSYYKLRKVRNKMCCFWNAKRVQR